MDEQPGAETRKCRKCGKEKPLTSFPKQAQNKGLRVHACRTCMSSNKLRNPDTIRQKRWRRKLGVSLTVSEFDKMVETQNGLCAICGRQTTLRVDHCHTTGRIRGLLCSPCNTGLGHFQDDPDRLQAAKEYLLR